MAIDIFLKIAGIEGEAQDASHVGEIDLLAWSWGASQNGTTHMGGGGGSGKVAVQDLSVTKYVDSATPGLLQKCFNGGHIKEASLVVRKAAGDTTLEYLLITMTDIIVSSVSTGGSGGEDRLTENVTLNFSQVTLAYIPQAADGSGGGEIEAGWNISANETLV
ncbi:MAG: type VI secretion system tube protein Hcp [Granulosicoccus sp.]